MTEKGESHKFYPLHDAQFDILNNDQRFRLAAAGTGGGKTAIGPLFLMSRIHLLLGSHKKIRLLVVAPTYQILQRATMPELMAAFFETEFEGILTKPSAYVYSIWGGQIEIWLVSAERPQNLEGGQFHACWIDEGGQIRYEAWIAIQGRLGLHRGHCLITTTPYSRNWLYHRFFKPFKTGDKDYYVRTWKSIDNPVYSLEEFERAKRTMSPQRFAMRYCGEFAKLAGLVWPQMDQCVDDFNEVPCAAGQGAHYGGIDWGWAPDPFVAIAGTLVMERTSPYYNHLFLWYLRCKNNVMIRDHSKALPRGVTWFADASNPEGIAELRADGHSVLPNKVQSIMLGIDAVQERVLERTIHIHPSIAPFVLAQTNEYHWPIKDEELIADKPEGPDHIPDAIRYEIVNIDRRRIAEAWKYAHDEHHKEAA